MKKTSVETSVGIFVLIGLLCVAYMAIKLGKMEWFGDDYYMLDARFDSVSGLKSGAQVDMAGVEIGQVAGIDLDNERQVAIVRMKIRKGIILTDDVIASVKTSGLIGDKYIKLTPGGSDRVLKSGDMIIETESALDVEELVSKYVFGDAGN
ncbi:outer membrane lipid asymmetry maintenance protein MlaD [Desulfosarcina ovata subsp. sediminis]|uniref:Outer membrane lipid asymmetry maintenance protein MlaD n=1 Tax=Desulfosarcina ovata subsp. sediminis TaxID=885957 RepID=A0A5K7ZTG2_9BACT|nr:outer membrane lipid asymmetry maintenance protein MlaD [Desulfosarcina ovata]BBO83495.1 outer membrane lipid asymmetry maintenance protein MlaD [Desulfosarcina ovata subsp. sediminis]